VPELAPIDAQSIEEVRAEHDVAVFATFASSDANDHALAVDISGLQVSFKYLISPSGT
jgi:hypothetical protein